MKSLASLLSDGNIADLAEQLESSLKSKTKVRIEEEKKRVAAKVFGEGSSESGIPTTKGSVKQLHEALTSAGYKKTKVGRGAHNSDGDVTLHHYYHQNGTHFRVTDLNKIEGGNFISWAHVKRKLSENTPRVVKRGTGKKSLNTYLQKIQK